MTLELSLKGGEGKDEDIASSRSSTGKGSAIRRTACSLVYPEYRVC